MIRLRCATSSRRASWKAQMRALGSRLRDMKPCGPARRRLGSAGCWPFWQRRWCCLPLRRSSPSPTAASFISAAASPEPPHQADGGTDRRQDAHGQRCRKAFNGVADPSGDRDQNRGDPPARSVSLFHLRSIFVVLRHIPLLPSTRRLLLVGDERADAGAARSEGAPVGAAHPPRAPARSGARAARRPRRRAPCAGPPCRLAAYDQTLGEVRIAIGSDNPYGLTWDTHIRAQAADLRPADARRHRQPAGTARPRRRRPKAPKGTGDVFRSDRPAWAAPPEKGESPAAAGLSKGGRYWARTSDLLLVEQALSQLS